MWKRLTLQPIFAGCPNRCRHCSDAAGPPFGAFMSVDEIRWLANGFRNASAKALGEPLDILVWEDGYESTAHPQFVEMLRCIRTFDYEPCESLSSNGYGVARLTDWRGPLSQMREMGYTALASAIHGVGDQHDRFVRRRGAYHDLEVAARRFLDVGMNVFFEIHLNRENIGELASIIEALQVNAPTYIDSLVTLNGGAIDNLPADSVVDVPAIVIGGEVRSIHVGALPLFAAELCRRQIVIHELVAQAAVTGDRQLALQALALDPYVRSITQAKAILDDFLREYQEDLPQFFH